MVTVRRVPVSWSMPHPEVVLRVLQGDVRHVAAAAGVGEAGQGGLVAAPVVVVGAAGRVLAQRA